MICSCIIEKIVLGCFKKMQYMEMKIGWNKEECLSKQNINLHCIIKHCIIKHGKVFLFKVNNRNTRKKCEICLTLKRLGAGVNVPATPVIFPKMYLLQRG